MPSFSTILSVKKAYYMLKSPSEPIYMSISARLECATLYYFKKNH